MLNHNLIRRYLRSSILTGLLLVLTSCNSSISEQQMLQNAKNYITQGNYKAASIELRSTIQTNNKNAEARYLLGKIYMQAGLYDLALQAFQRANKNGWDAEQTQIYLAQIYLEQNKPKNLLYNISDNTNWSKQRRADILSLRALAEAQLGQKVQAKKTLKQASTLDSEALHVLNTTALFQLSKLLNGDYVRTIEKALVLYPDSTEILLLRGSIYMQTGDTLEASDIYKKIINLDPANIITPGSKKAAIALSNIYISQKQYSQARTSLTKILAKNQNDPVINYLIGLVAYKEKNYPQAEIHIQKTLNSIPEHTPSIQLIGRIKYASKDYDQAALKFAKYLKIVPTDISTQKILAQTYIFLNQTIKAQSIVNNILINNSNDVTGLKLKSQILYSQGNTNSSISTLLSAIKSNPKDTGLREQLIRSYISSGKTSQALSEIKVFETLSTNTEAVKKLTISALVKANKIPQAIKIAEEMSITNPHNSEILSLNGSLHAANYNNTKARFFFEKARRQNNSLSATLGLARINKTEGNLAKARSLYKSLIEKNLGNTLPMLALSEIAAQEKKTNEMLSWLEKARNADTHEIQARLILSDYYLKKSDPKQADIYLQEALLLAPEKTEAQTLQSKILIAQKRYNEALLPLKKLFEKKPDSIEINYLLGEIFLRQNLKIKARNHLLKVLHQDKNHLLANTLMAELELKDNYRKSLDYTRNIQNIRPDFYVGYMLEGNIWMLKNNHQRASTAYSKAWKRQQTAELAIKLYSASNPISSFDDAIKPLIIWLSNKPDDTKTRLFLAVTYQVINKNNDAIKQYEKILKQEPNNETVLNNLAWLYSLTNESRALTLAEKAYRTAPNNAGILDTYGWILVQKNRTSQGIRLIKQALDQQPDILDIQYHYAVALLKTGDSNRSKTLLKNLLDQEKPFFGRNDAERLFKTLL